MAQYFDSLGGFMCLFLKFDEVKLGLTCSLLSIIDLGLVTCGSSSELVLELGNFGSLVG